MIDELNLLGDFWHFRYEDRIGPRTRVRRWLRGRPRWIAQGGACVTDSPGVLVNPTTCSVKEVDVSQVNTRGTTVTNGIDQERLLA